MEEQKYTHVGVRIISRLKELGLKQADLCRETGLSTTAMSQYCTGKRVPDTASLHKIALVLKTSMEWVLTGEDATVVNVTNEDAACDGRPLSPLENDLVAMFRLLPEAAQKEVFDLVHFKYTRLTGGEKESIFWTYFDESEDEKSSPIQGKKAQDETA